MIILARISEWLLQQVQSNFKFQNPSSRYPPFGTHLDNNGNLKVCGHDSHYGHALIVR